MKKNVVNDKVIRAMAIGISAMLAATTPMTALAAEEGEGAAPEPSTGEEANAESKVAEAKDAADSASDSVKDAQSSADTVKSDVETNVEAGEAGTGSKGNDLAQDVIDAAANVENSVSENGSTPLIDTATDIENANIQIETAEDNDELSDAEYNKADEAAENVADIASDVKDAMDEANAKADEQVQQIENATTVADANAAYDELVATANQAQTDFDTKLDAYNEAKSAYDEAAKKVAEYEAAYNAAVESADKNAAAAQAELEKAKANAAALEQAVTAAKSAVDTSAKAAMEIAEKEDLTRNDGTLDWRNEDKLFIAIMEKYYLPETLGIQGATVTRVEGKDKNEYNYFKAEYTDAEGNGQVKYYNYKMDDNGKSKDDIVIFEKREVEIFGDANETPDQYVKDNDQKTVVDVEAGLEEDSVVDANGKYYEYESKKEETLVSNSDVTGTSKEDVTVNDTTKQESWQYDAETGELVKTVTADVTTITYTDANFTSDQSYATDAERDAAAGEKEKEFEEATGKDATITETEETTYTYTATGTYIPTFTKTVNVKNEEVEWKHTNKLNDFGVKTEAEAIAQVKKKEEKDLQREIEKEDDLYFLGVSSKLEVTGYTENEWYDDSDFLVSGTVSATYAKVTKQTVDQSTFGALWDDIKSLFGGQSTNEKLEKAARETIEAEGGIFLSANWDDWSFNKATIRYVAGVKVTTDEKQTEQAAKDAVEDAALAQAKANGATGVYNVKSTGANTLEHTTYSYTVDYLKKDTEETVNKAVATETYGNAIGLSGQIIQNKNYKDGNILLTQKDEDYRAFVDDAKDITGKYNRLLEEAQKANADVAIAQDQVAALKAEIEALKKESGNKTKLAELEAKLAIAQADRDEAEETLNDILDKLEEAGVTRDEVVDRLTPDTPGDNGGNAGNDNPGGTPETTGEGAGVDTTTGGPATVVTAQAEAPINTTIAQEAPGAAPENTVVTAQVAGARRNMAGGNTAGKVVVEDQSVVTIEEEKTPLAASIRKQDDSDAKIVNIEDEETPLAASTDQQKMSWWWLLIVMVLGTTGYEMYRRHQKKKKAVEEINAEE